MPIFDQGYQHWTGTLSGHAWRWLTITRQGVRVSTKGPFLRLLVLAAWTPAVVLAALLCLWGLVERKSGLIASLREMLAAMFPSELLAEPQKYRMVVWTLGYHYFLQIELRISMVVVLLVGPALISQDLRLNALPLYFSRPLRRIDYFLGKLGVIAWFLGLVVLVPPLIAYVLGLLFSLDFSTLKDTFPLLLACLAYGAVIVLSAGTLMLALSSLSRNSRYIALFWVGLWFVSSIVAGTLEEVAREQRREALDRRLMEVRGSKKFPQRPFRPEEQRAFGEWAQQAVAEHSEAELQAARTNWRPLLSYTANLSRLGQQLLNTDASMHELSRLQPPEMRKHFLKEALGPQYPWYWSAGVLTALFGLSAWLLNYRVRSLDRLK